MEKTEKVEKKLFKVTIEENGKVVHEIESDCIAAVINDLEDEDDCFSGIFMSSCRLGIIANALEAMDKVKANILDRHPELMLVALKKSLESAKSESKSKSESQGERFSDLLAKLLK